MEIEHQPSRQRFVHESGGYSAVLEYVMLTRDRIDFKRTFVPEELRGRGIAERLVRTGLAWARAQGYAIEASCWYAQRFLRRSDA